jgi:hypothetical protein
MSQKSSVQFTPSNVPQLLTADRGFWGGQTMEKGIAGSKSVGGAIARIGSRASIVIGVGLEIYGAHAVFKAYETCKAGGE